MPSLPATPAPRETTDRTRLGVARGAQLSHRVVGRLERGAQRERNLQHGREKVGSVLTPAVPVKPCRNQLDRRGGNSARALDRVGGRSDAQRVALLRQLSGVGLGARGARCHGVGGAAFPQFPTRP